MKTLIGFLFCLLISPGILVAEQLYTGNTSVYQYKVSKSNYSLNFGSADSQSTYFKGTHQKRSSSTSSKYKSHKSHYSKTKYASSVNKSKTSSHYGVERDKNGKIKRSTSEKHAFMKQSGYPKGRPGYVVDHIIPLKKGGCDCPSNMQWQTIKAAKEKDKWE